MSQHGRAGPADAAPAGTEARRGPGEAVAPDVELRLPAEADSVGVARQVIAGVGDHLELDENRMADIALALTEACTNVVMHAYPHGAGGYEVRVWAQQRRLLVSVRDHGQGIAPRVSSDRAGLGLGLSLMLAVCDEVAFVRGGEGSTEVRMAFLLDGDGGPS